jgi:excisionase family DNA binding protein
MNKKQAAQHLDVSTRAIERYTAKGKLTPTYEKGRTGPAPVYDKAQLDELKKEMEAMISTPRPPVKDKKPAKKDKPDKGNGIIIRPNKNNDLIELLAAIDRARTPSTLDVSAKLLLSISEAQKLTGLSDQHLRDAIHSGRLKGKIIGRGYKLKRTDLDLYIRKL